MSDTTTSKSFYYDIDLQKNSLLQAKLQNISTVDRTALASSLNTDDKGLVVYDTDLLILYLWDGNAWQSTTVSGFDSSHWSTAYDRSIIDIEATSTETETNLVITSEDNSTLQTTWQHGYIHTQSSPASTWTIVHNLNKYPSVTIVDTANSEVIGEVNYLNNNQLSVVFSAGFSGKAYLN